MAKVKIGDVIEIPTKKGIALAQYTHQHKTFGALIRVFKKLYSSLDTEDLANSVTDEVLFSTFFPLQAAINMKIFKVMTNQQITAELQKFPIFRDGLPNKSGIVHNWWLWDGETETPIGPLSEEQKKFPIRALWNDTILIERIESRWTPETDFTTVLSST
jgi:co-chaperonin GroES (HSP10)